MFNVCCTCEYTSDRLQISLELLFLSLLLTLGLSKYFSLKESTSCCSFNCNSSRLYWSPIGAEEGGAFHNLLSKFQSFPGPVSLHIDFTFPLSVTQLSLLAPYSLSWL